MVPPAAERKGARRRCCYWTGRYQTANTMCIGLPHDRLPRRSATPRATRIRASHWIRKPNVSCQSCHGPGARHVEWAKRGDKAGYGAGRRTRRAIRPDGKRARGECRGNRDRHLCRLPLTRRAELVAAPAAAISGSTSYLPSLLVQGAVPRPTAKQLDEVYVDGSRFARAECTKKGVACTSETTTAAHRQLKVAGSTARIPHRSCHVPAPQSGLRERGEAISTRPRIRFHKQGSAGAQ